MEIIFHCGYCFTTYNINLHLFTLQADPTIKDNKGRAPLHWAAIGSSPEVTKVCFDAFNNNGDFSLIFSLCC